MKSQFKAAHNSLKEMQNVMNIFENEVKSQEVKYNDVITQPTRKPKAPSSKKRNIHAKQSPNVKKVININNNNTKNLFKESFFKQEKAWVPVLNKLINEDSQKMKNKPKMSGCSKQEMHGIIGKDLNDWDAPLLMVECGKEARPGYSQVKAHEYHDTPATLKKKVKTLANLIRASENAIIYSGAGISTASGIPDYASKAGQNKTLAKRGKKSANGYVLPTFSHRALTGMFHNGLLKRWIQQNHDGLPQKAGMPQHDVNEIHGSWYDPSNPVVPMTGTLRTDLYKDLSKWESKTDLCIAIGTSLSGMGADCCVHTPAQKFEHMGVGFGSVIIGIQKTGEDVHSSLRIFALIDEVFVLLCQELEVLPTPLHKNPRAKRYPKHIEPVENVFIVPYDKNGNLSKTGETSYLDLRPLNQNLQLTMGPGKGFKGECVGRTLEGHFRIRLPHQREGSKKHGKGTSIYKLGSWWIESLVYGREPKLPLINLKQFNKVGANVKTKCVAITKSKKGNGGVRSYKDLEF